MASTIGKLKDVPQNSMLCDTIITKYGISDRSTEYPCAKQSIEIEVVRWEDQERESEKSRKIQYTMHSYYSQ